MLAYSLGEYSDPVGELSYKVSMLLKCKWLGKEISQLFFRSGVDDLDFLVRYVIAYGVVTYIDVLGSIVYRTSLAESFSTLIIDM